MRLAGETTRRSDVNDSIPLQQTFLGATDRKVTTYRCGVRPVAAWNILRRWARLYPLSFAKLAKDRSASRLDSIMTHDHTPHRFLQTLLLVTTKSWSARVARGEGSDRSGSTC